MRSALLLLSCLTLAVPAAAQSGDEAALRSELQRLRGELDALGARARDRDSQLEALAKEMSALADHVGGLRAAFPLPVSGPFLSAPPPSSDTAGVAKVAVLAPKIEVDAGRRHDTLFLKLRRIEADGVRLLSEIEMAQDQTTLELPLDRSGALYVLEWSTSDGYSYPILLRDGASGLPAATCQVKPLQAQGRFVLVGYKLE